MSNSRVNKILKWKSGEGILGTGAIGKQVVICEFCFTRLLLLSLGINLKNTTILLLKRSIKHFIVACDSQIHLPELLLLLLFCLVIIFLVDILTYFLALLSFVIKSL